MPRNDQHRPSEIDPTQYVYFGWDYYGSSEGDMGYVLLLRDERLRQAEQRMQHGYKPTKHEHGGTCGCCGAMAMHVVIYRHLPTGDLLTVGETCSDKMGSGDKALFRKLRKQLKDALARKAGKAKAHALLLTEYGCTQETADALLALDDNWPHEEALAFEVLGAGSMADLPKRVFSVTQWDSSFATDDVGQLNPEQYHEYNTACDDAQEAYCTARHEVMNNAYRVGGRRWFYSILKSRQTLCEMVRNLVKYGSWSDKQLAFVRTLHGRTLTGTQDIAIARDKHIAERANTAPIPTEYSDKRVLVEGTVVAIKDPDQNAPYPAHKMLVQHASGWKLWGTLPSVMSPDDKGAKVQFMAKVTISDSDPSFGFYSRATKVVLTTDVPVTA